MAVLCLTGATAATAAPIVIDFESYTVGQVLVGGTDLGGVYIDQDIEIWGENQFPPDATGNVAFNQSPVFGDFSGGFTSEVSSFSIAVGDNCCDLDSATLSVFDVGMNLLATASFTDQAVGQTLFVAAAGIKFFSVDQSNAVVFDNLTFEAAEIDPEPVPEPASLLLLGAGLAAIGARVRSQRRK